MYEGYIKALITTIYNGCVISMDGEGDKEIVRRILEVRKKYKILGYICLCYSKEKVWTR